MERTMKLTITATAELTTIDGVPVRRWRGVTENGIECDVFVHRLRVRSDKDTAEFERCLVKQLPPGQTIDMRFIV